MKKIVGILNPFDATQSFYFYEDGNRIDRLTCSLNEIPSSLISFASNYGVTDVDVSGPQFFSQAIVKEIDTYMINKYNAKKININII